LPAHLSRPLAVGTGIVLLVTGLVLVMLLSTDWLDGPLGVGRRMALAAELYVVEADGTSRASLTDEPGLMHWGPALSPDGQTLVYTFALPPEPGVLVLANADGTGRRPFAVGRATGYLAIWSPDGSRLAYIAQEGGDTDTAELMVMDADGNNPRRLTTNQAPEYGASWSPDGRRIAFGSKQDGIWRIYVIDVEGSDMRALVGSEQGNAPSWSPDGRMIAFTSDRMGNDDIYVVDAEGGPARRLTTANRHHDNAVWSPDGRQLAFNSDRDGTNDLFVMDADGGNLRNLTRTPELAEVVATWTPDGQRLIVSANALERARVWSVPALRGVGMGLLTGLMAAILLMRSPSQTVQGS